MPPEDGAPRRPEERKGVLDKLFLEHYGAIVVQLMAKYPLLARDAAHAAYVKLRKPTIRWEAVKSPKSYLFKIAIREAENMAHGTAWARRVQADSELAAQRVNESAAAPSGESSADPGGDAEAAFNSLSELQKQVYVLNTEDGLPARMIAAVLGISQDRAERALTTARRAMKEVLSNTSQGRPRK